MTDIGTTLKASIYRVANDAFGFNFDDYLVAYQREIYGVIINPATRKLDPLFGEIPEKFLSTINTSFHDSIAGYKVDVGSHFKSLAMNVDLFLLNINNLNDDPRLTDPLILHELCHMVIDSRYIANIPFKIDKTDSYNGNKLFNKTDKQNVRIHRHTLEFCEILAASAGKMQTADSRYSDRWNLINLAMRYDIKGILRI